MAPSTVLADDLAELADVLEGVDDEFAAVARALRDLTPEDVGPPAVATAVTEVTTRLERRLGALATETADAARVVRRRLADVSPSTDRAGRSGHAAGQSERSQPSPRSAREEP